MKVLFVGSGGGHLAHLWALRSWWQGVERSWVCVEGSAAAARLEGERVRWVPGPTQRSPRAVLHNLAVSPAHLGRERPDVVISAGAAIALPWFVTARSMGIPTVFIEVIDRVEVPSLTARLVRPFASKMVVHWPEQQEALPGAICLGPLWGGSA